MLIKDGEYLAIFIFPIGDAYCTVFDAGFVRKDCRLLTMQLQFGKERSIKVPFMERKSPAFYTLYFLTVA